MESFGFNELPEMVKSLLEKVEHIEQLLSSQAKSENVSQNLITIETAADFLGISKQALYSMCSRKTIRHYKPGKRLYFDKADLEEWIRSGKSKTR